MRPTRFLFLLPLVAMLGLLFAACAPAASTPAPPSPTPAQPQSSTPDPTSAPTATAATTSARPQLIEFYTTW